ncbi:hypothetical protein GCM10010238_62830 [Streptomyces griseoviridis]|uniref:Uncharacterized protein n=1 Tax=Streptomyces griseoviridis TaxID=45398 RepID=A0A918GUU5_STRGD|nr:hypothetical protein GCM10010238_62830 [Streptomyces niveoruber]
MPASDEWRLRRDGTAVLCRERDCGAVSRTGLRWWCGRDGSDPWERDRPVGTGPYRRDGTDPSKRDRPVETGLACRNGTDSPGRDRPVGTVAACSAGFRRSGA